MSERSPRRSGLGSPFAGTSLVDMLQHRAATQPDDTAYTFLRDGEVPGARLTWSELDLISRSVAGWLQQRTSRGDRVLLLYPPGLDFIGAFFGCVYASVLAVPVLPPQGSRARRGVDRIASIAGDAEPRCVLTSAELRDQLTREITDGLLGSTPRTAGLVATDDLPSGLETSWQRPDLVPGTIAFLQYTSGSTARPKGVMVSHGNLLHNLGAAFHLGDSGADSVSVSWLPVTHDMGLIEGVLQPAFSGCPAYLMSPGAFLQRPARWLKAISAYRATRSGGPNFAYDLAVTRVAAGERDGLDLGPWRAAYNGAEPVRHDTMDAFANAFASSGFSASAFRPCYGLAESTLLVTTGRWARERPDEGPLSCGTPGHGSAVRIVDPGQRMADAGDVARCADGEIGEIQVGGPSVTHGYWNLPVETAATFVEGVDGRWLRTGDLGFMRDSELYVTGRLKDMLIVRGAKHFPQDLERTAERRHAAVRAGAVAAVAVDGGVRGDRIALIAEVDPRRMGDTDPDTLVGDLRQAVADAHGIQLHGVALVAAGTIPRTPSGKLRRFLCRDAWLGGTLAPLALWSEPAERRAV